MAESSRLNGNEDSVSDFFINRDVQFGGHFNRYGETIRDRNVFQFVSGFSRTVYLDLEL